MNRTAIYPSEMALESVAPERAESGLALGQSGIVEIESGRWVDETGPLTLPEPPAMSFGDFIGASPAVRRMYPLCSRLAGVEVPLVIEGETGTGKEALAEA